MSQTPPPHDPDTPASEPEGEPRAGSGGEPRAGSEGEPRAGSEGEPRAGSEGEPRAGSEGAQAQGGVAVPQAPQAPHEEPAPGPSDAGTAQAPPDAGQVPGSGEPRVPRGLLDSAVGVLISPRKTLRSLAAHPRMAWAFVVVVVLSALSTIAEGPGADPTAGVPGAPAAPDGAAAALYVTRIVGGALLAAGLLAAGAAIVHALARLLGGAGEFRATVTVLGFATVPSALAIPAQLLPALPLDALVAGTLGGLISVGLFVWVVILLVLGVRTAHRVSAGRAFAALVLPFVVLGVGSLVLIIGLAVALVGAFA